LQGDGIRFAGIPGLERGLEGRIQPRSVRRRQILGEHLHYLLLEPGHRPAEKVLGLDNKDRGRDPQ